MKGAALIATNYPPHTRLLNDVDVLVAAEDYGRAREALIAGGFRVVTGAHSEQERLAAKAQVVFINRHAAGSAAVAVAVDLHTRIYAQGRRYLFDTPILLRRRIPAQLGTLTASVLEPVDVLLHLATQLLNAQLLATLLRLADLRLSFSRVDPALCDQRAAETGSRNALAFARAAVAQVFLNDAAALRTVTPMDRRASTIARELVKQGWPWAGSLPHLPESYRQMAAHIVQDGFRGALVNSWRRANEYRQNRRRSGASAVHSALGGMRKLARSVISLARLRWDMRSK
jgi:hypothetical protein